MTQQYQHLDIFSDWVEEACKQQALYQRVAPGPEAQRHVREELGFCAGPETPLNVRIEPRWERDGVNGEAVSWSVGYGPRTSAYVLRPAGAAAPQVRPGDAEVSVCLAEEMAGGQ